MSSNLLHLQAMSLVMANIINIWVNYKDFRPKSSTQSQKTKILDTKTCSGPTLKAPTQGTNIFFDPKKILLYLKCPSLNSFTPITPASYFIS